MSVNWNTSECEAYIEAKKHDEASDEWLEYCTLRNTLIYALLVTQFPKGNWQITDKNWREVYRRLNVLEQCRGANRTQVVEGIRTDKCFTPEEIFSMINMSVNAGTMTDPAFNRRMIKLMSQDAAQDLRVFDNNWKAKQEK